MLAITGLSMVTALGLDAANSCAAARAGISRITSLPHLTVEHPETFEFEPVSILSVPQIVEGFSGIARLSGLACYALHDLLKTHPLKKQQKVGLILNLSSQFFKRWAEMQKASEEKRPYQVQTSETVQRLIQNKQILTRHLQERTGLNATLIHIFTDDQTGFLNALQQARAWLDANQVEMCIVGGVDSLVELSTLHLLNDCGVLKTPSNSNGFIAGEGAGFLCIEKGEKAQQRKATILGAIHAEGWAKEPFHRFDEAKNPLGVAYTQALTHTLGQLSNQGNSLEWIHTALNGDAYRTTDWGFATVRVKAQFPHFGEQNTEHPVVHFGETNAASGFLATGLALRGFERNYLPPQVLCALHNESGERGTFIVQKV